MSEECFHVFWWDPEGVIHYEKESVDAKTAVETAHSLTRRPAVLLGIIRKVMITDGGDLCVLLWEHDKGLVHPPELKKAQEDLDRSS